MAASQRVDLVGSERVAPSVGRRSGDVDLSAGATVTVYLRPPEGAPDLNWVDEGLSARPWMTREEFAEHHGTADTDLALLQKVAADHHLTLDDHDRGARRLRVTGSLGDLAAAFGAELLQWQDGAQSYRVRRGSLQLPEELEDVVTGVFGLDQRPQAQPHFRVQAKAAAIQYTPVEVATRYEFPSGADGTGECVAIIELGGGFREEDLTAYFQTLGLSVPQINAVLVDGGTNTPGQPSGPDGEVMLDIEVVGAVSPGASIAVYFAPNTDQGFLDAVTTAVHDITNKPSVVSISWGGPESTWTTQAMTQMESAFQAAAALGVSVTVAAGDNGSTDGVTDGLQHVDFPASAPHALACGGTKLERRSERVWNELASSEGATGGGVSSRFPLPSYQSDANVPVSVNAGGAAGRGVPDVAGNADPTTGYTIRVDGETTVIGGTSAVAPLWAALLARLNQALGRSVGFVQPLLYATPKSFTDIRSGDNGAYKAEKGWDACTGLGSPKGAALLSALQAK